MWFSTWLNDRTTNRAARRRTLRRASPSHSRPQLETLEDRWLPSTLTVTNLGDGVPGSLRYEIYESQPKDTIVFDKNLFVNYVQGKKTLEPQTIMLFLGDLDISHNLTINGPGANLLTITSEPYTDELFDTFNGSRIFEVDGANTTATLSGLSMTNGGGTDYGGGIPDRPYDGYGGAILNFGSLTVSNCSLGGNASTFANDAVYGGALANFGEMQVTGCELSANYAHFVFLTGGLTGALGGGIYNAGAATISNSTLEGSSAYQGGGIYNAGTATVSNSTLEGNSAYQGGGIFDSGGLVLYSSSLAYNTATQAGGGLYVSTDGTVTVKKSSSITGNSAPAGYGADVYNLGLVYLDSASTIGVLDGNPAKAI